MKRWIVAVICALFLVASPSTVAFAETESETETVVTPNEVEDMIAAIDVSYPKEEDVKAAREAYEALTKAQKVNVDNMDLLRAAELKIEERNGKTPDDSQKRGTKYSFRISDYVPKVTISVRYMTDPDGDGMMEEPNIKLISPTGETYTLPKDQTSISGLRYDFSVRRTEASATVDVLKAENGTWTIEANNEVFFTLSDYAEKPSYEEIENGTDSTKPAEEKKSNENNEKNDTSLLPLIGLIACVGALIFLFVMMKKTPSSKAEKEKKEKAAVKDDRAESEEEYQEELQRLLADYAKSRGKEDTPTKDPEPKVVEEDSRLFESVLAENLTEDDGLSPVEEENHGGRFK